MIDDRVLIS